MYIKKYINNLSINTYMNIHIIQIAYATVNTTIYLKYILRI